MHLYRHLSVGGAAVFLALALACDDGSSSRTTGPPPPDGSDLVAPQPVTDLVLVYRPATQDIEIAWTAPRDDDETDRVARYDIRYSYSFPVDWDLSVAITDPPAPEAEGTPQSYVLADPVRGRDIYTAARTFDAAGNASAIGALAHMRVPGIRFEALCEDVFTRSPVEGLDALLTAGTSWNLVTGADGMLVIEDVMSGALGIRIETGAAADPYHRHQNTLVVSNDVALSIPMIRVIPATMAPYQNTLQVVLDALVTAGGGSVLKRWHSYPIPWRAPEFVNVHGLDYTDLTRQAAAQWNTRTGLEIFVEVPAIPAAGIEMRYLSRASMGIQNGFTEHKNDADDYPAGEIIRIVDDFSDGAKLYTILMHEFGHTIRLGHLPAGFIMFGGQPLPADITDDEVRAVQMMLAIPNGTNLDRYDALTP